MASTPVTPVFTVENRARPLLPPSNETQAALDGDPKAPRSAGPGGQVDKGYAWVICVAVCFLYINTDGFTFTLNILFNVFLEKYGETAAHTTLVGSVLVSIMLLSGPLISFAMTRLGVRFVCVAGSLIAALGAALGVFANSLLFHILTLSVLTGFGFGCIWVTGTYSIDVWFRARQPFAMGLATVVSGVGMFIYPALTSYLTAEYGLEGYFLIISGVILQGCIFGLFLRPPPLSALTDSANPLAPDTVKPSGYDFSIFRNWQFDLLLLSIFLFASSFFPWMEFSFVRAKTFPGITAGELEFLPTALGISNIFGRIVATVLLSCRFVNKAILTASVELACGVTVCLSVFCWDYTSQLICSIIYGLLQGFTNPALGIVMRDVVPVELLPIAAGFFFVPLGLAGITGAPLVGVISDSTRQNYTILFLAMGGVVICAALVLLGIGVAKFRANKSAQMKLI